LALVQGLLLWWLLSGMPADRWPAGDARVLLPPTLLIAVLPLSLQLLWPFRRERVLHVAFAGGALFVAVTAAWFAATHIGLDAPGSDGRPRRYDSDGDTVAAFVLPLALAWLLAMPLLKLRLTGGCWTGPYPSLFDITWRGALTLAEAALFTGVFWLLMGLAGMLFGLLGMDAVSNFISEPLFAIPATTLVGTLAIHLIGASAGMVDGLLRQLLNLLKWLLPLAGLIVIAFALALLPKLPALLAEGRKVMDAIWLLWLAAVTVLLLNAAYQSGQEPPGYGRLIEQALRVAPPLLIVIALTALYSLAVRTSTFGLTPARYWGLVTAAAATAYAVGYSVAAWAPGRWFARMGGINIVMALALLAVLLLSLTPLADPLRLSVDSQARRALSAADDKAQDAALRFLGREAGTSGRNRLDGIARLSDAEGGSAALRAAALAARRPTDPRGDDFEAWSARIEPLPAAAPVAPLEPGLQTALRTTRDKDPILGAVRRMMLLRTDLDADGISDVLLVDDDGLNQYWLFTVGAGDVWTLRSSGRLLYSGASDADLRAALRRGDFGALPRMTQDLRVGERRLTLWPTETSPSEAMAQD
ncbi:MAG: hypothetical protein ACKO9D_04545, partial [Gammaproteobacteria bacterium]